MKSTYSYANIIPRKSSYLEKENNHRTRFRMSLNPIPTMYPESLVKDMPSFLPNLTPLRKAPTKRIFSPDEINSTSYNKNLEVKDYSQLNESTLQYLDEGYLCSSTCEDHIAFYKMEKTTASIPAVTESIRIDAKLHVQLYFKRCPLPCIASLVL